MDEVRIQSREFSPPRHCERTCLNAKKLLELAAKEDKGLEKMVRTFLFGEVTEAETPDLSHLPKKISRGFSARDIAMLKKAGVIEGAKCSSAFKVPKKDPTKSRSDDPP